MEKLQPTLRFPEFVEDWQPLLFKHVYSFRSTNSFSRDKLNYLDGEVLNLHYGDIHSKFNSLFDESKEIVPFINRDVSIEKISTDNYLKKGDLVIADASEDYADIGKAIEIVNLNDQKILAGLHTFIARPDKFDMASGFGSYLLKIEKSKLQIKTIAQGTKVLSISATRLSNINISIPSLSEQTKIASFLSAVDEKLNLLTEKKAALEEYKKGMMQKIFSQEIKFKDENGKDFSDWEYKSLGACLDYEQPTPYLVNSTDYNDSFETPVLTAGKTFILGYTNEAFGIYKNHPIIIFDDFTTATQYVDFPFKAKSSAMKILKTKGNDNIKFLYEAIQMINFEIGGHGRHWISVFSLMEILIPSIEEQTKIATFLSAIDEKIELVATQITDTQEYKKGLLQGMFC